MTIPKRKISWSQLIHNKIIIDKRKEMASWLYFLDKRQEEDISYFTI
jgi:hypothetical protein